MATYRVTYARIFQMTVDVEADGEWEALEKAHQLEQEGQLGFDLVYAKDLPPNELVYFERPGSTIDDIFDDESTWFAEEVNE